MTSNILDVKDEKLNVVLGSTNLLSDVDEFKVPKAEVEDHIAYKALSLGKPRKDLTKEQIDEIQLNDDDNNINIIMDSFAKGEINQETKDVLIQYYQNGMEIYAAFVEATNELFDAEPISKNYINLLEGDVDKKTMYHNQHIGPKTTMILDYEIDAPYTIENDIIAIENAKIQQDSILKVKSFRPKSSPKRKVSLILPMMKNVARSIEKVKVGGEYDREYKKELAKIIPGKTAEESGCDKAKLRKPIDKFRDALRCTIIAPFYEDILYLYNKSLSTDKAIKSSRKSKYLDNDVNNRESFFNNLKNYRDMKNYLKVDVNQEISGVYEKRGKSRTKTGFLAEVQYKTEKQFYEGDILTHKEYEVARKLQQSYHGLTLDADKMLCNRKIYSRLLNIQNINRQTFSGYNDFIMEHAKEYEDRLVKSGVDSNKDGSFDLISKFLEKNMFVRSSVALQHDSFAKSGAVVQEIYSKYKPVVDKKYLVDITNTSNHEVLKAMYQKKMHNHN